MRRITLLALAFAAGCDGGSAEGGDGIAVTDSAGVRITVYARSFAHDADLELRELLRIGVVEGGSEFMFGSIAGGLVLSDGSLVLADGSSGQVRRFSSEGHFLGSHGREGEGPGEYRYIRGMARCSPRGFTVFDIDYRMSRYDESGTFVEVSPVRLEGLASPYHMACQADGRIAAINWDLAGGSRLGFHTALARLRILDADGTERTDFGERIGSERFGRPAGSGPHPAGRSTLFGFQQKDLIVADGSFFGFERWSEEGKLTELVRLEMPAKDVESIMAEYMEISLARAASDEQRRAWRQEIEAMEGPERASYISGLHVTDDRVLVRELSVSRTGRWFEFAADGTPVGWWPLPPASVLLDVQGELVLVAERDELGVPRAVLYQIVPGPDRTGA